MKKKNARTLAIGSGIACLGAAASGALPPLPPWAAAIALVCTFPLFVASLGLWWSAEEGEDDIPFVGY
ncbi:MAG: hypothetical protein QMD46_07790 [Methanomicrobiales archaeon]|nr:hypothetical protein [Methanomicrobiales archaeon]MDI6877116.1 hypothetical protein [Methanomicrobiales archaeon]